MARITTFRLKALTSGATPAHSKEPSRPRKVRPRLEELEDRLQLSVGDTIANAIGLSFTNTSAAVQTAHVAGYLADPSDFRLHRISLDAGDVVTASVNTARYGSGLNSYLRIFQANGGNPVRQVASNDDFQGRDPGLSFQAPVTGVYYVGVSSFDNTAYDPAEAGSGSVSSGGLFDLKLSKTTAPLASDLVGAAFQVSKALAEWGETVTVSYTVQNRGGLEAPPSALSLLLSANNLFEDGIPPLQTVALPALAAGDAFKGSFTVALGVPGVPALPFLDSQTIFLGLQRGPTGPDRPEQGNDWAPLQMLRSETDADNESHTTMATAKQIALDSRASDVTLAPGDRNFFKIVLTEAGNLAASVDAAGGTLSLTLYDAQGLPIVRSDGQSATTPGPFITHGLMGRAEDGGTIYYLKVANLGEEASTCTLTTLFTPSASMLASIPLGAGPVAIVRGDFNGDGRSDLVTADLNGDDSLHRHGVRVLLGNGDGTFQKAGFFSVGGPPEALLAGDFNGDGRLDLAAANAGTDGVRVLLGNGDGTFQDFLTVTGPGGTSLAGGDFNGDGRLDLAVADPIAGTVRVLPGDGRGGFLSALTVAVPDGPAAPAAQDFNEDGRLDLAVVNETSDQVTVLLGQEDGTFLSAGSFAVGADPVALAAGDFDGDGHVDLAAANFHSRSVTVLLGDGHGNFQNSGSYAVGDHPLSLVTGDFDGDGRVDLAAANAASNYVTVLLGREGGSFHGAGTFAVGVEPFALVAGDFDEDGRVDLAAADYLSRSVDVLLGNGNGTFLDAESPNPAGQLPGALVREDFNGDGLLDLATANEASGDVTVLLGQGDGTFQNAGSFAVGDNPQALATGDFNGDGRPDLAAANYTSNDVTILLGNGEGTLHKVRSYTLGGKLSALVAGDFNGDGHIDLAAAIKLNADPSLGSKVTLLLGDGQGAFEEGGSFTAGMEAQALTAGDFDGDTHLDLAVANAYSQDVRVLLGDGHGSFEEKGPYAVGGRPMALVAGDFDGDTDFDLAVATACSGVTVLLNDGRGVFQDAGPHDLGTTIRSLAAGDFNGDDQLDLATADLLYYYDYSPANRVTVLLGNGHGSFQNAGSFPVGDRPASIVAGDFNGDGRPDLATASSAAASVTALLGTGTGAFLSPALTPSLVRSTPLVANLTGGQAPDAVVLTQTGHILFRRGLAENPGAFAPPVVLNPGLQSTARDLALVPTAGGASLLAALDARASATTHMPRVSLYRPNPDGTFTALPGLDLPAGFLPANIASADLTGEGLGDLVITAAASGQVFVSLRTDSQGFGPAVPYRVGVNPSAIDLVDVNNDTHRDILVTDRFAGQVSVLINQGNGLFDPEERFRAGVGLYGLAPVNGAAAVQSLQGTSGVVTGLFDGRTGMDLVVINRGADRFTLLSGDNDGGFLNPQPALTFFTTGPPTAVVAACLNTGDDSLDLAILSKDSDSVSIYRGDSLGGFTWVCTVNAGSQPTGLAVADVTRPGGGGPDSIPDLLVGNAFGDLLILAGNGDGTYSPYRRADQNVSLAVARSPGSGQRTFYFADQRNDQLAYKQADPGTPTVTGPTVYQDRSTSIQAPGPQAVVTVADMQYLVVANSGGNEVLIYPIGQDGRPDPAGKQTYFTGTDPTSITLTTPANDLNHDTTPDLVVANEGSNDVSVFLGRLLGNTWTLAYRPRQSSGGLGPTAVAIEDVTSADGTGTPDGTPDLLVSNGQSSQVSVLPSRGDGFFINQSSEDALSLLTGSSPRELFVGNFDGASGLDLVTVNTGSNDVTLIANFLTTPVTSTISSGGTFPVAAVAADFNGDGPGDLLVANVGNGVLELLLGGPGGLQVARTRVDAAVPHLSDLALVTAGNELEVYGTDAGREAAVLLETFVLPRPVPNFFPPGPGFPEGLEIPGDGQAAILGESDAPPFPLAQAVATVPEIGTLVSQRVFHEGLADGDLNGEPSSATSGSAEESASQNVKPGTEAQVDLRPWGSASGILLNNLIDPENNGSGQSGLNDEAQSYESLRELDQLSNTSSRGLPHVAQSGKWMADAPLLDPFWKLIGSELWLAEDPTAQSLQAVQRSVQGFLEQGPLPAGFGQHSALPPTLPQERFRHPRSPDSWQERAWPVPLRINRSARERSEDQDLSTEEYDPEESVAAARSAGLSWKDALAAAMAITGFWQAGSRDGAARQAPWLWDFRHF